MRIISWKRVSSIGWHGLATFLLSIAAITASGGITLLICWTIVLKFARSRATPDDRAAAVLVLGAMLQRGRITGDFKARLERATQFSEGSTLFILGGVTDSSRLSEAAAGREWLVGQGTCETRIVLEDESRNTLENLLFAREILRVRGVERPVIVTSRYHAARSSILAAGLGIAHDLCPAEWPSIMHPAAFARSLFEALMINWYYVGKLWAIVTRYNGMLSRIS